MPKFKNVQMQRLYDAMLVAAADRTSELYHNREGLPRRGAGHRAAFWDGVSGKFTLNGPTRSANVIAGTLSSACFQAGQAWARKLAADASKAGPGRGGAGRNQGRKPVAPESRRAPRAMRLTDSEWRDAKFVGLDPFRAWVSVRAAALRSAEGIPAAETSVPVIVLRVLASATEPLDAYQVSKAEDRVMTPMEVGQTLADLERAGLVVSADASGTHNDLARRFRPA